MTVVVVLPCVPRCRPARVQPSLRPAPRHGESRNATFARSYKLRVVLRHCRRDDERSRAVDVRGIVRLDDHAESLEVGGGIRVGVAPGDRYSTSQEQLGQRAHSGAGDAYKVNRTRVAGVEERHGVRCGNIDAISRPVMRRRGRQRKNVLCDVVRRMRARMRRGAAGETVELERILEEPANRRVEPLH